MSARKLSGIVAGVIVVVMGGAIGIASCKQEAPPAPPPPAPAAPAPAPAAQAAPAGKGNISGVVTLTGTPPVMEPLKRGSDPVCAKTDMRDESALVKNGKIENVVIRVKNGPTVAPPSSTVEIDQKDCMYRPRVQGAVAGQAVAIRNTDGTLHNVHTYSGSHTLFNQAQPPHSPAFDKKFDDSAGVVKFKCDVHPWMTGYVVINNNPYFATTGADGKFEIKDVPAGTWQLEAWHEKFGTKTIQVTVTPNQTAPAVFNYSADDRG